MIMNTTGETDRHVVFGLLDYSLFGLTLLLSALIGIYFAFFDPKRENTRNGYLMGSRSMGIFPISMSLIASYISGISLLALPAEIYVYGTQYWLAVLSEVPGSFTMSFVYLPVFHHLKIMSSYEYLELRFNKTVRLFGSILFIVKMLLYIPIVVYVPALAFSQVTGFNLHLITPMVCIVCIFYTMLGGLKAVVWTDTLQTILMFGGVIAVLILGIIHVGGPYTVWERSRASGRIEFFNFDTDLTVRHTVWSVVFGNYCSWVAACTVNQAMVQRSLAMPTYKKANITIAILAVGIMCIVSLCCYTGMVIFASFYDCDPLITKQISKADQLLPHFVMKVSENIPGLPGLFMAGIFSAALSSMSTGLNSMTGVIYEDMIHPLVNRNISEAGASFVMKVMVAIIGIICVALVFLVEKLGTLLQAGKSLGAITAGPLLGMFSLGMFFPWANSKGALAGGVISLLFTGWLSFGGQAAIASGQIYYEKKPVTADGCPSLNATVEPIPIFDESQVFIMYRLSYLWYTLISTCTTLLVGLVISFISGPTKSTDIKRELLTPIIHRFLPSPKVSSEIEMKPEGKECK